MTHLLLPDPSLPNQKRVAKVLEFHDDALPVSTVALLLRMDPAHCKRVIDALQRYGEVKLATVKRTGYYTDG